jgi:photoactive yellow protein
MLGVNEGRVMKINIEQRLLGMSEAQLDEFPLGVIGVDALGTVVLYNAAEAELARCSATSTLGRNFFTDVAPCTAVRQFQGRFEDFVRRRDSVCEEFRFVFRFAWGDKEVGITFVRSSQEAERLFIVVNATTIEEVYGLT